MMQMLLFANMGCYNEEDGNEDDKEDAAHDDEKEEVEHVEDKDRSMMAR
jgi:hypothetical protein